MFWEVVELLFDKPMHKTPPRRQVVISSRFLENNKIYILSQIIIIEILFFETRTEMMDRNGINKSHSPEDESGLDFRVWDLADAAEIILFGPSDIVVYENMK